MKDKKVAVIILNYNTWKDTLDEVELCNRVSGILYENIIIVDNASQNESQKKLEEALNGKCILLFSKINGGYASGNNMGLRYAYEKGYQYAWILNNDIDYEDVNILESMLSVFEKDERIAIVNPDVYAPNGYLYNRDVVRPGLWDYTLGLLNYRKKGRQMIDNGGFGYVYRPQGCCMLVDLDKLHEIDYMDEKTFLYVEEPILAERLATRNYRCACCTITNVIHNHSKTVKTYVAKKEIRRLNNASFRYYLSAYRGFNSLEVFLCIVFNTLKMMLL